MQKKRKSIREEWKGWDKSEQSPRKMGVKLLPKRIPGYGPH